MLIAYVLALTSTNHLMGVLAVPALVVYVALDRLAGRSPGPRCIVGIVLAVVVGISLNYLWLPIRAGQYPPINEGEPVGFFSQALKDVLNRVQYGKPRWASGRPASPASSPTSGSTSPGSSPATGAGSARRGDRPLHRAGPERALGALEVATAAPGWPALALLGTLSLGLVFYMNFKYGFSQYPDQPSLPREVRERDYFFIGSFAVFGAFVALRAGRADAVDRGRACADRGHRRARAGPPRRPVLALALIPLARQPRHRQPGARDDGPRLRPRHARSRSSPTAS